MRNALLYIQVTVLTVAVLVAALDLGRADLRVPLNYTVGGDVMLHATMYKGIADNGWYLENPWLGAPGVMKLYDFPLCENALFLGVKVLTALTGDPYLAGNLFYLATYLMAAWAALFVLRQFGVGGQVAVAASLLFAFLPYHFWHGAPHASLSNYAAIPLVAMVALWLCAGEPVLFRRDDAGRLRWSWSWGRSAPALAACGLAALSGPYYAFFGTFLLLVGGLIGVLRRPGMDRVLDAAAAAGLLAGLFAVQLVPFVAYAVARGGEPGGDEAPRRQLLPVRPASREPAQARSGSPPAAWAPARPRSRGRAHSAVQRDERGRDRTGAGPGRGLAACSSRSSAGWPLPASRPAAAPRWGTLAN